MREDELAECAETSARLDASETVLPGPELLAGLLMLRSRVISECDGVRVVGLWSRFGAWTDAQAMRALSDATPAGDADGPRLMVHEVAAFTHTSELATGTRMGLMLQVRDALPLCWEALDAGRLTTAHVSALAGVLAVAPPPTSIAVEAVVLPQAVAAGWTPAQVRQAARRALIAVDPDGAAERAESARELSDVRLYAEEHEMASLVATGDAATTRTVMDAIDARAVQLRSAGDTRPIGVLRVAALAETVLGKQSIAPHVEAVVQIDLTTLLGLTRNPGELAGYGPISDETARRLATDATLRRLITDPLTHTALDLGHTAYRPSRALRRFIETRDRSCQFPGCTRRSLRCDLDHACDYERGGPTSRRNLHALCRTDHNLKTRKLWRVDRHRDGTETWTSRQGYRYLRPAPSQPIADLDPPDDPWPTVECPGVDNHSDASGHPGETDDIPPGEPPPLDNDDREHAETLIEAAAWARFDRACYANYWQTRAAS